MYNKNKMILVSIFIRELRTKCVQPNVPRLVRFFPSVRFYEGVVELSLTAAEKKDPQGLGLHFHKHGEPEEDLLGLQAFQERRVLGPANV